MGCAVHCRHPEVREARAEAERKYIDNVREEQVLAEETSREAEQRRLKAFDSQIEGKRQKAVHEAKAAVKASKQRAVGVAQSQREQVDELAARDAEADRLRTEAAEVDNELSRYAVETVRAHSSAPRAVSFFLGF